MEMRGYVVISPHRSKTYMELYQANSVIDVFFSGIGQGEKVNVVVVTFLYGKTLKNKIF